MTESVTGERQSLSGGVRSRPALPTDVNALVRICSKCFPEYYKWQSIYPIGKNWWQVAIESKASQIIVLEDSSGIFALDVLVLALELWKAENKRRNGSLMARVFSAFCCPVPAVWKRLWKVALARLTYRRPVRNSVLERNCEQTAWLEYIAVLPRMVRQGHASWLFRIHEQGALAAGSTTINTHVDSENVPSRRMMEKMGYKLISEDIRGCLYGKSLV